MDEMIYRFGDILLEDKNQNDLINNVSNPMLNPNRSLVLAEGKYQASVNSFVEHKSAILDESLEFIDSHNDFLEKIN